MHVKQLKYKINCYRAASFKLSSRVLLSLNCAVLSTIITAKIGKQSNMLKLLKEATVLIPEINVTLPPDFCENKFMTTCKSQTAWPKINQMKVESVIRIQSHLSLIGQLTFFVMSCPSSLLTTYSIFISPSILKILGPGFKHQNLTQIQTPTSSSLATSL